MKAFLVVLFLFTGGSLSYLAHRIDQLRERIRELEQTDQAHRESHR